MLPDLLGGPAAGLHIHRVVLAGTAGASLAVLRGRGSLSVFLLLLLHLLYDFPDLALCSLGEGGGSKSRGSGPAPLVPPTPPATRN